MHSLSIHYGYIAAVYTIITILNINPLPIHPSDITDVYTETPRQTLNVPIHPSDITDVYT